MGQEQKKYHITDDGDIYKVNKDGSFTAMGNAEEHKPDVERRKNTSESRDRLISLENMLISEQGNLLSPQEIEFVARYSQNSEALGMLAYLEDGRYFPLLVKRFENGATFLEDSVLQGGQWADEEIIKLSLANCRRKFNDDGILTALGKDKDARISQAAKRNPNYTGKGDGCLGVIILFIITTSTLITIL